MQLWSKTVRFQSVFKILLAFQLYEVNQLQEIENLYNDGLGNSGSIQIVPFKQLYFNAQELYILTSSVPIGRHRQKHTPTEAQKCWLLDLVLRPLQKSRYVVAPQRY